MSRVLAMSCLGLVLLLLLVPEPSHQQIHRDAQTSDENVDDALSILRTVKRRFVSLKRERVTDCRTWNDQCDPWNRDPSAECCDQSSFVCRCNLWMQNCRCVARAWGK